MSYLINPYIYAASVVLPNQLPSVTTENDTFNDEGTSTTGWTASNATLAQSGSVLRQTKDVGGSNSSMTKSITFTPNNEDYILYGKVKAKDAANCVSVLWLLNGSKEVSIWFGSANASGTYSGQSVSICGTTGASTRNVLQISGSTAFETNYVDFLLHFDYKFSTLECYFRESGQWVYKGRVACDYFSSADVQLLTTTGSPAGAWIEFDFITLAQPNLVAIGDSICAGSTGFNPDRATYPLLTDYTSTWMYYAKVYPNLRNNFIVNKGVGSQSSTQINARISDATDCSPQVVFLHASTNDEVLGISQTTRTSNIQSSINSINAAGAECVLLNAVYGTSTCPDNTPNPDLRDYMLDWWNNYRSGLTGLNCYVDIMNPITTSGFQTAAQTQSDGIHPKPSGYNLVGTFILSFDETAINSYAFDFYMAINDFTANDRQALITLVNDLNGYGILSKMYALYPIIAGTSTSCKYNLMNPLDTDAAYRIVFSGGITFASTGMVSNGTTGYGDTKFNPFVVMTNTNCGASVYIRNNMSSNSNGLLTAASDFTSINNNFGIGDYNGGADLRGYGGASLAGGASSTSTATGLITVSMNGSRVQNLYIDGVAAGTTPTAAANLPNYNLAIMAGNYGSGGVQLYSTSEIAFAAIHQGLSATEAANLHTAVQAYQTTLGRQV